MTIYRLVFLISSVFISSGTVASDKCRSLKFDVLSINDGLSQGMVNSIIQDQYGFMWFGTKDGLNRYDGYQFTVYKHNASDINSLSDNFIRYLFEDKKGRIWIATANNGLDLFDRNTETFIHFQHNAFDKNSLSNNYVTSIAEDHFGCLWIGTVEGLNRLHIEEKNGSQNTDLTRLNATELFMANHDVKFTHVVFDSNNPQTEYYTRIDGFPLSDTYASNFTIDQSGLMWISTYGKLFQIKISDTSTYQLIELPLARYMRSKETDKGLENFVQLFIEDTSEKIMYLVFEYGITSVSTLTGQVEYLSQYRNHTGVFAHPGVIDSDGNIWTAESDHAELFNVKNKEWIRINSKDNNLLIMLHNINCTFRDRSGIIWLGTRGYGLLKYNPRFEKFHSTDKNSIGWMAAANENTIVVNKLNYLLSVFNITNKDYELSISDKAFSHLPYFTDFGVTNAILQDADGSFWLAKQCLSHYDIKTNVIERYRLQNTSVFPLFDDGNNCLWFGTEKNFVCFNKTTKQSLEYNYPVKPTSVPYDFLQTIYQDKNKIFWLGTINGLFRFNSSNNEWKQYKHIRNDSTSLSFDLVFSICPDPYEPEKYLWIGTNGGGLNRFDKKTGTCIRYTQKSGLPNDVIYGIMSDEDKNLWLSTNNGLCRFNIKKNQIKNFEEKDGLQGNEFNRYAYCKKGSLLFFGGVNGFNFFNPAELHDNTFSPPVLITDFKLNNQSVPFGHNSTLKKPAYLTRTITLNYNQNIFSIVFAAFDFTASKKNIYQYRLIGFDDNWIFAGTNNSATFTNLDPGEYTFEVKGSNNDGIMNPQAASLTIIVMPPWYMTWWFRTAVLLGVTGSIYTLYRYRINKILEMQHVRNTIARDLHDEIGSNLSSISIFSEVAKIKLNENDEATTLLKKITNYAQQSQEAMSDIVWMINASNDRFVNITNRMKIYATELTEAKNIQLTFETDNRLDDVKLDMNQRRSLYLIFKEAINNMAKYSHASEAIVKLNRLNNCVQMVVSDNGIGFDPVTKNDQVSQNGNGLINMKKRTESLNGSLEIVSSSGHGTTIMLRFEV